jgi:non-specific serine/threonine protein kinase
MSQHYETRGTENRRFSVVEFSMTKRTAQLPSFATRLIGRETEIDEILELLRTNRLVTLTGPGGVGKTRLAVEAARATAEGFDGGVSFVSLAPVREWELVVPAIATALGVRITGSIAAVDELARHLADQVQLLVLDNLEQVLECGPDIATLLKSCPNLSILTTSRVVLRLSGERIFEVLPLRLPSVGNASPLRNLGDFPAVDLFVERARAVDPAFTCNDQNSTDVVEICTRLDGLPLAIELAAARVRVLPPAALLPRIEKRLPLLTIGARDAPVRQQTLRNTLAWSYDLLSSDEQEVFRRLSVFVGGFTLGAVETICAKRADLPADTSTLEPMLGVISTLTDHSLIRKAGTSEVPRFGMLETVREFGLDLLKAHDELDATRRRHAEWVADFVEKIRPGIEGPDGLAVLDQLELGHSNIRAALGYVLEAEDAGLGNRIIASVWKSWVVHAHRREARMWVERVEDRLGDLSPACLLEAVYALGNFSLDEEERESARRWGEDGLRRARDSGDRQREAAMLLLLGLVAEGEKDDRTAVGLFDRALALAQKLGPEIPLADHLAAMVLVNRGVSLVYLDELDRALVDVREAFEIFTWRGDEWGIGISTEILAFIARERGQLEQAAALYRQNLERYRDLGDRDGFANCITGIAAVAAKIGRATQAVRLLSANVAIRTQIHAPLPRLRQNEYGDAVAAARANLGSRRFEAAWRAGQEMTLEAIIAEATSVQLNLSPSQQAPFRLTPRQLEILRLMAEGNTDQEIGDALFISYRTVTSHVQNILNQMGVDSRTAASTYALRLGLI